jgi:hypothetical protein
MLISLAIGLLFAFVLTMVLGRQAGGPLSGFVLFFLLIFMSVWAFGLWLAPLGPPVHGVHWLGFVLTGLLLFLILAAVIPPPEKRATLDLERPEKKAARKTMAFLFGIYFWLVILLFIALIVSSQYFRPVP